MSGEVETDRDGRVCTITLRNEGKRNAITYGMLAELRDAVDRLDGADERPVLVLRGAGERAFSAGADLTQDRDESGRGRWRDATDAVADYPYPTIAMVNGDTYGGAVHLAATCDVRVGRRGARFGITPARIGIVYPPLAIERVMALVGPAKTKELLFTAEAIDAEAAHEIGLLNHVVPAADLEERTYDMAETMASNAPLSLTSMKRVVDAAVDAGSLSAAELEWARELTAESFSSEDYAEGRAAFAEGRAPEFTGQ